MDLPTLHGLAATVSNRRDLSKLEGRQSGATGDSRRNGTEHGLMENGGLVHLVEDEEMHSNDDSTMSADMPWDEQERDHEGVTQLRKYRKADNLSAPPLVDEIVLGEEEEKKTAKLERERLKQSLIYPKSEDAIRRTPGASQVQQHFEDQIQLMRRTPGAAKMHRSAVANVSPTSSDRTGLGYGLSLNAQVTASSEEEHTFLHPLPPQHATHVFQTATLR